MRNTLVKTTLSCNLYGAAAADPGPNPAGQAPSLPTRGCGSGGTPSTGYNQTRLDRPVKFSNDDRAWFDNIPWTGWWVGRGGDGQKLWSERFFVLIILWWFWEPEIANTLFGVGQKVRYSLGKNPHTVEQSYMVIRGSRGSYRLVLDVKWVHNSKTKHFSM